MNLILSNDSIGQNINCLFRQMACMSIDGQSDRSIQCTQPFQVHAQEGV